MALKNRDDFERYVNACLEKRSTKKTRVLVCYGQGCAVRGAQGLLKALEDEIKAQGLDGQAEVVPTGCHGLCSIAPSVIIEPQGVLYGNVTPEDAKKIVVKTIKSGAIVEELCVKEGDKPLPYIQDIPFFANQTRIALRNVGKINPYEIDDAIASGAYQGFVKALFEMTPEKIIEEVSLSGLRGRGGAGFHTGRKWASCRKAKGDRKFVVCNGDEGDPGAFKDRALMHGDPHAIIEGMLIGAYAVGAKEGFIFTRDEYPLAVHIFSLKKAVEDARRLGLLGERVLGTDFSFDIELAFGGGAYVCGESSALMRSIEGKPPEPRAKYIHGTEKGLFDLPTVLNNCESWADVPFIILKGAKVFASFGREKSKGTKVFSVSGAIKNIGLVEMPMGVPLGKVVMDVGGGVRNGRQLKAVQTGGPSGGVVPASMLDSPLDFESLQSASSALGSGGMIVLDDTTCMVSLALYFVRFLMEESCGKCTPCREGLVQMEKILSRICEGKGRMSDIEKLKELGGAMKLACLCDLGRSAPNPLFATFKHFYNEYIEHIQEGFCRAGQCRDLCSFNINEGACDGCHECVPLCHKGAIFGEKGKVHYIDKTLCDSCGDCLRVCTRNAILVEKPVLRKAMEA